MPFGREVKIVVEVPKAIQESALKATWMDGLRSGAIAGLLVGLLLGYLLWRQSRA